MTVRLTGRCTVDTVQEITSMLIEKIQANKGQPPLSIDFSEVNEVDLSFFQLLHSVKKEKTIQFSPSLSPKFKDAALWCGLPEIVEKGTR